MAFRFYNFSVIVPGPGVPFIPDILVYSAPTDRYQDLKGLAPSVVIQLVATQLNALPVDYAGFSIQRSDDFGNTWSDIAGWITDSFFWVDIPPAPGVYLYRARTRVSAGAESAHGNEVTVTAGLWDNEDNLGVNDVEATGALADRLEGKDPFPNGLDGLQHQGMSLSEGSMAGGYGGGAWYIEESELEPPTVYGHSPACGATGVLDPLTVITLKLQDQPYPGGSGIDDTKTAIWLSVTSQGGGSFRKIFDGGAQPWAPTVTVVSVPGVDPNLDRNVTITVAGGYISPNDVVVVRAYAQDNNGNFVVDECTFEMEPKDNDPPSVDNQDPECGTGLQADDPRRAPQDTTFSFTVTDPDSGVNIATLQVYYGTDPGGPWTQVLQNGSTWLGGFTGSVTAITDGYRVTIRRPVTDPLWPADSQICFRVTVDDNEDNSAEDICCFKTATCVTYTVRPIAENILLVEFSSPVTNNESLRAPSNYVIAPEDPDLAEGVVVKRVLPQRFAPPDDPLRPDTRLGVGDPDLVFLDTSLLTPWGIYTLQILNVVDKFGNNLCPLEDPVRFRARRTKVDEGRDSQQDNPLLQQDSLMRRLLIALQHENEIVGGVFIPDDWFSL